MGGLGLELCCISGRGLSDRMLSGAELDAEDVATLD